MLKSRLTVVTFFFVSIGIAFPAVADKTGGYCQPGWDMTPKLQGEPRDRNDNKWACTKQVNGNGNGDGQNVKDDGFPNGP